MNIAFEMSRREAMTSTQRRVWLACSGDLDCMAQSVTRGLEISGALDVERLRLCLQTLQHSHACLRTHFVVDDGEVWQQTDADTPLDFAVLEVQPGEAGGVIDGVCRSRYDLSAGPLFACRVLRLSAERHLVLLNAHPIVLDGDACAGLLRALGLAYGGQAGAAGAPPPVTTAPEQLRQFWHAQLAGAAPLMTFPTDVPRPARMTCCGSLVRLPVAAPLAARLRALCAQQQCEPEDLLLGVYQVFLYRYSGQADSIVGAALRHGGEAEDAPWTGRGANVMPRRQLLTPQLPFTELLDRNKALREQLAAHGQYQLEEMLAEQLSEHNESHALIFQHRFACLHDDHPAGGFGGLDATVVALADPIGTLDTGFIMACGPQGWQGFLQYNTGLFEAASAERWAANLATLLVSVAEAPATPIGELALLHPDELGFIAASLDRAGAPFAPRHASVHAAFEQQAARTPDAIALRCGTEQLSYAQLNARADAIAAHLHQLGVGADDLVGICTARGNDMVAAVIGVLKTGAAYVPMDIKYPQLRLEAIAAEAQLRFVLCDARGSGMFGAGAGNSAREVLLAEVPAAAPPFVSPATGPTSLCHVIFTSGSTGKPKGVMAGHHNVLAFLDWIWATYPVPQLRVVLCCSSLCFDLTVFELWGPLTVGGTVVVVENAVSLVQQQVPDLTLLNTVPTALRLLLDERALPPSVQAVNVCGEPLDGQLVTDLFAQYPGVVFYNTYGPTEDTAYSTFYKMTGPVEGDPPIGIPILHEYGRVVDAHGMAAPVGAVGELLIGGAGVAQGYLYNPQFTAERFLAARDYAGRPSREYRSGDFVRLRNNGQLQFVGRRDDQIKLRGFRIDLGDVVSALLQVPGVTDARVLVRQHNGGDVLVAYLSHVDMAPGGGRDAALTARVEADTSARLPAYMVPACFVLFDRLPLNDNGKVDRHALRAVAFDTGPATVLQEVWSDDERAIGEVWKAVLAVDRIGRDDDFFQLGGNSLLAVRMISRLNRAFDTNLPSQVVFKDRTVASLAALIRRAVVTDAVRLARIDLGGGVSPTYPQLAMLMNADKISFNLCSAMRIDGRFEPAALRGALRRLLARHDALRARFVVDGPAARMHIADAPAEILTLAELTDQADVDAAVQAEWCLPFDLQAGPPVRALLLRQAAERHVLVLSIHHVVTDEWSTNIVKRDLARGYRAELAELLAPAQPGTAHDGAEAELPFRYGDYAGWQARLHNTDEFARQLAYWTNEFQQVRVEGAFPQGGVGPHGVAPATAYLQLALPATTARQMAALSARHGYTQYVVLMAALQLTLAEYSGLEQQLVWSPVARRTEPELEESVGMYTNLVAISARASRELQLGQFLAQIERKVAQSRSNSDLSALTAVMFDPTLMPALPMIGLNFIDLPNEADWVFDGATVTPIPLLLEQEADLCALELTVRAGQATFAYNTALFHDADVARLAARLWDIVDGFERRPEAAIGAVLAPPPEQAAVAAAA